MKQTINDFRMRFNLNNTKIKEEKGKIKIDLSVEFDRNGDLIQYKGLKR